MRSLRLTSLLLFSVIAAVLSIAAGHEDERPAKPVVRTPDLGIFADRRYTDLGRHIDSRLFAPGRGPEEEDEDRPRADEPDGAQQFFLRRRLRKGQTELPVDSYLKAIGKADSMPQFSTATNRSDIARRNLPEDDQRRLQMSTWTSLGPGNIGGRTRAIAFDPVNPNNIYAAGVAGGVWRSTNGGSSWTPIFDLLPNINVSTLLVDPSNPSIIYAGTGENFAGDLGLRGAGIFKTTNAGASWTQLPSTDRPEFQYINDLIISPTNSQRLYAATNRGIFRTTDGGLAWTKILDQNYCVDLAIRTDLPTDGILAACETGSILFRNTDAAGSGTWTNVLTENGMGRTTIAIAPSDQNIVYAASAENSTVANGALHSFWKSVDGGLTWTATSRITDPPTINNALFSSGCSGSATYSQGWYDNAIAVDPADPNRVWVGGINIFRSDDGGYNWGHASYFDIHVDTHALVFDPRYNGTTNTTLLVGGDGGLYKTANARGTLGSPCSHDTGIQWTNINNNYGVTQFYHGMPYPDGIRYLGGSQDNGTVRGGDIAGINGWTTLRSGDGGYVAIDPNNTNTIYVESQHLNIMKSTDGGLNFRNVSGPIPYESFDFIVPFQMDPRNSQTLWVGGTSLWRTVDGADSWVRASTAFSTNIHSIGISPNDSNLVIVGTDNAIYRSTSALSAGATTAWTLSPGSPSGYVSCIAFDPHSANVVYATVSTFGVAHVYRSIDSGNSWASIDGVGAGALPDVPAHSIVVDPNDSARLYVGTDIGVFVSLNSGASWARENTGFANVITESLAISGTGSNAKLFAFTHGRGAWSVRLTDSNACAFSLSPTIRYFDASGGPGSTSVINEAGCQWTATVNAPNFSYVPSSPAALILHDRTGNNVDPTGSTPYPSTINLSGRIGTITDVEVTVHDVTHSFPDDLDLMLEGPGGQRVVLMSDAGGGSSITAPIDLTFKQSGALLPDAGAITAGAYKPANYPGHATYEPGGVDNFPSPGPGPGVYPSDLTVFNGKDANGVWKLYALDDESGDIGVIAGGWSLKVTTTGGQTSWLNVPTLTGTGTSAINYTLSPNTTLGIRTATITVNGEVHTIEQAAHAGVPPPPVIDQPSNVSATGFSLVWQYLPSDAAAGFRLDMATDPNFVNPVPGYQDLDLGLVSARTLTGLTAGVTYYCRIRAYNDFGPSGNSNVVTAITGGSGPTPSPTVAPSVTPTPVATPSPIATPTPTPQPTPSPVATVKTVSYTGPVITIPDNSTTGVNIILPVTGVGTLSDLDMIFDGTSCSSVSGATTVGLDHSWMGDVVVKLTSPQGTTVTLLTQPGGTSNSGNNLCQLTLDDEAGTRSIQSITAAEAPFTGKFMPNSPLSAFDGQNANGNWTLNVSDRAASDTGHVRAFSLRFTSGATTNPNPTPTPVSPTPTPTPTSPTPTLTPTPTATPVASPTATPGVKTVGYTGPVIIIPDNDANGVNVTLPVSGVGTISDVDLSFDGTSCNTTAGSTTVGLDHTWMGDVVVKLTSPQGTTVTVLSQPGGTSNAGHNLCQTIIDDEAGTKSVQNVTAAEAPYTGKFTPNAPFSAFDGQNANGNWVLNVSDRAQADTGRLRAFSLRFTSGTVVSPTPTPSPNASPTVTPTPTPTPTPTSRTVSYTGAAVAIPDNSTTGVNLTLAVSGVATITDLNFSIDGTSCSTTTGSTTVGLTHAWIGDVVIKLTSPQGTTVTLVNQAGTVNNSGRNICQMVLDDEATTRSIQSVTAAEAPYTGSYKPNSPLSAFDGQNPNGTWTLNVSDRSQYDSGTIRAFSLRFNSTTAGRIESWWVPEYLTQLTALF